MKKQICTFCKTIYQKPSFNPKAIKHFCSTGCRSEWQKINLKGNNNPNFKTGVYVDPKCDCGNIKDCRSKSCSSCSKKSFKIGKKNNYLSKEDILKFINNSTTFSELAEMLQTSRETIKRYIDIYHIDTTNFKYFGKYKDGHGAPISFDVLFAQNGKVRHNTVKRVIIKNNLIPYCCAECGIDGIWKGKKLTLDLDHINGINFDNRLENLRFLCPNCHSQTNTFKGRNAKRK